MKRELNFAKDIFISNLGRNKTPFKITFAITYKCNLRCNICQIWKKKAQEELSKGKIIKIFNYIKPSWINFTGGEPFLRNDLTEIVTEIIERNNNIYDFTLTTNGVLTGRIVNFAQKVIELDKLPQFIISVSFGGPPQAHDKQRGVYGAFKKAINTFRALREIQKKEKKFKVFVGYTISPFNLGQLGETIAYFKKEISNFSLNEFHVNLCERSKHYYGNENLKISNIFMSQAFSQIDWLIKKKGFRNKVEFLDYLYLRLMRKYVINRKTPLPCKTLASSIFINPVGDVYPCVTWDNKLGNLKELNYDISKIWRSDLTSKLQSNIIKNQCPNCWTACEAYQTILGNLLNALFI